MRELQNPIDMINRLQIQCSTCRRDFLMDTVIKTTSKPKQGCSVHLTIQYWKQINRYIEDQNRWNCLFFRFVLTIILFVAGVIVVMFLNAERFSISGQILHFTIFGCMIHTAGLILAIMFAEGLLLCQDDSVFILDIKRHLYWQFLVPGINRGMCDNGVVCNTRLCSCFAILLLYYYINYGASTCAVEMDLERNPICENTASCGNNK
jgi:hypothetical protein